MWAEVVFGDVPEVVTRLDDIDFSARYTLSRACYETQAAGGAPYWLEKRRCPARCVFDKLGDSWPGRRTGRCRGRRRSGRRDGGGGFSDDRGGNGADEDTGQEPQRPATCTVRTADQVGDLGDDVE